MSEAHQTFIQIHFTYYYYIGYAYFSNLKKYIIKYSWKFTA